MWNSENFCDSYGFFPNRKIYVKLKFLRFTAATVIEKANIILQNESKILQRKLEIGKFNERCEPGISTKERITTKLILLKQGAELCSFASLKWSRKLLVHHAFWITDDKVFSSLFKPKKIIPCLNLVQIMLETSNFARKYTHICSFRKYTF